MASMDLLENDIGAQGMPAKPKSKRNAKAGRRGKANKRGAAAAGNDAAPGGSRARGGIGGFIFAVVSLISALLVIAVVLAGSLFFAVRANLFGIADTYRDQLSTVPALNWALPRVIDPSDPESLEREDLLVAYRMLEEERDAAEARAVAAEETRDQALAETALMRRYKDQADAQELVARENQDAIDRQRSQLDAEKKQLDDMKYDLERIATQGDTEGFRQYFESTSPEVAQEIYAQIVIEQQADDDKKAFAKLYEGMDAASAAAIFESLGESKADLIVSALRTMKRDRATDILSKMNPAFAAAVSVKLAAP